MQKKLICRRLTRFKKRLCKEPLKDGHLCKTSWSSIEDVLKTFLQDVSKTFWRCMAKTKILIMIKTSWRRLQDVFWRRMTSGNMSWRRLGKTSWRGLEDVWPKRKYWSWSSCLEDVFKTYSEDIWLERIYSSWSRRLPLKTKTKDVFKTSSSRRMFAGKPVVFLFLISNWYFASYGSLVYK